MNRKIAPAITDAVDFDLRLKPCKIFNLDNGVPVYSLHAGAQEILNLELLFFAGSWYEPQRMVAAVTNHMLKSGTTTRTSFEIEESIDYYGAQFSRAAYSEYALLSLQTLTRHTDALLPIMADVLTDSVFPQEELDIYKQNSLQRLKVNLQKPDFVANRLIDSYLYGTEHPYGSYTNPEDISNINRESLQEFYRQHYVNGECAIFVSGYLPANLEETLNKNFGSLSLKKASFHVERKPMFPAEQKKYRVQNDPDAVQGAIRIARPFAGRRSEDFQRILVLNTLLGGFFGSRLMSNIREEKGYTYGIHSYVQNHMHDTAWMVSCEAGKDVCEATINEIYKEMQLLREVPVDEEELLLVKNYILGNALMTLDGPFQIMSRWKTLIINGYDEQFFYKTIQTVKDMSAEGVMQLAQKYLQPQDFYELVVY